jgi:hypothetical protein
MNDATLKLIDALKAAGKTVKANGQDSYMAQCPAHDDGRPSLSVRKGVGQVLTFCFAGCTAESIVQALGMTMADLYDNPKGKSYEYLENGKLLRAVHRSPNKEFRQTIIDKGRVTLFDPNGGNSYKGLTVWLPEGEKDAELLASQGQIAVSAPMGASNWAKCDYSPLYSAAEVIILADNDEPGMARAHGLYAHLTANGVETCIKRAKVGKDITDHIVAGEGLQDLIEVTPVPTSDTSQGYTPRLYADIEAAIKGGVTTPQPTVGLREDGAYLFYAGTVNGLFGAPESGKTLIALTVMADELLAGHSALLVDVDYNGVATTVSRLRSFGVPDTTLLDPTRFRYCAPEDPQDLLAIVAEAQAWNPSFVLVDSVGEVLPMFGASSNSADDYTTVHRQVFAALAECGACVVIVDHEPKSAKTAESGAGGTIAKIRTLHGAYYRVTVTQPFAPGHGGKAKLNIYKDRNGGVREHSPKGEAHPLAATFHLKAIGEATDWVFYTPGESGTYKATDPDLATLRAIPGVMDMSVRKIQDLTGISKNKVGPLKKQLEAEKVSPGAVPVPFLKERGQGQTLTPVPLGHSGTGQGQGQFDSLGAGA